MEENNRIRKQPPLYILITGKARSGKDTVAKLMKTEIEYGLNNYVAQPIILAFADIIKNVSRRNHNYKNKAEDRETLLVVGDMLREQNPNVFTESMMPIVDAYNKSGYDCFIFSDVRLQREFDYLNNHGSGIPYVIEVVNENIEDQLSDKTKNHLTETEGANEDYKIKVDFSHPEGVSKTIKEIRRVLEEIAEHYWDFTVGNDLFR